MTEEGETVYLRIYDLSQGLARQLSLSIIGKSIDAIYHTGVVFLGREYWFGGGIESAPVGGAPYGNPIQILNLGKTEIPLDIFQDFLREIGPRYTPATYNLLRHNCNNFSDEVVNFLLGKGIPENILRLPLEVTSTPVGSLLIPMLEQMESGLRHGGNGMSHPPQPVPYHASPSHLLPPPLLAATASPPPPTHPISSQSTPVTVAEEDKKVPVGSKQVTDAILTGSSNTTTNSTNSSFPKPSTAAELSKGEVKMQMQAEIAKEFAKVMASGRFGANEAAAVALLNVKKRHENMNLT